MSDQALLDLLGALVAQTSRLANSAEAIASVIAPAPNLTRPMIDWPHAADILESLGATIVGHDADGPTRAEYQGRIYVRRSAKADEEDEKSDAIWFNCVVGGNVKDGNVKWARLLTFRDRKTDKLPNGAKKLKVAAPAQPARTGPARPQAEIDAQRARLKAEVDGNLPPAPPTMPPQPSELDAHFGPRQPRAPYADDAGTARREFYKAASEAIGTGKMTTQAINELVKAANGNGFVAALAALEEKLKA